MLSQAEEKKLGEILVARKLLTLEEYQICLQIQKEETSKSLEDILVEKQLVSLEDIVQIKNSFLLDTIVPNKNFTLPGIRLVKKLGEGGMGVVYKGIQISLERPVAVKILDPLLGKDKNFVARFSQEARLLAKLDHPNVIKGIDFRESQGIYYYVMEYVPGKNVEEIVKAEGPMKEHQALSVVLQISRALERAQQIGLVHRDLKPTNIIISNNGKAKLCDLGLAKWKKAQLGITQKGTVIGTTYYISPEQAQGEIDLDIRSDIYSLGATLYFMLTGHPPYKGVNASIIYYQHIHEAPPKVTEVRPDLPRSIDKLLSLMMAKDITQRVQNPSALIHLLEHYLRKKKKETVKKTHKSEARRTTKAHKKIEISLKEKENVLESKEEKRTEEVGEEKSREEIIPDLQITCPLCSHVFPTVSPKIQCPSCNHAFDFPKGFHKNRLGFFYFIQKILLIVLTILCIFLIGGEIFLHSIPRKVLENSFFPQKEILLFIRDTQREFFK